jgi:membrane-bound lytic murein transglycosylase MltF
MRLAAVMAAVMSMCGPVDQAKPVNSCPQWETLLHVHNPGWDVGRMSRIMWRESRCQPEVRSRTRDTGLLQINDVNHRFLSQRLGAVGVEELRDPDVNVRAAAELFRFWDSHGSSGYLPWRATK